MDLFREIFWYFGVALFVTSLVFFWSLLGYCITLGLKDKFIKE